ncbi:hypothetical protein BT69DRAFT_1126644 [Atractiella rhizophila]|nr:hypothetical protein BT69DRAFT_1126644 [Atractiella rhizophila]
MDSQGEDSETTPLLPSAQSTPKEVRKGKNRTIVLPLSLLSFVALSCVIVLVVLGRKEEVGEEKGWTICSSAGKRQIYTVDYADDGKPQGDMWQECVEVNGGRFGKFVARDTNLSPTYTLPEGSILTPGFSDSHVHMIQYGWSRSLDLANLPDLPAVIAKIRRYIEEEWDGTGWVEGQGWYEQSWEGWTGGFPNKTHLDADPVLRRVPIILSRKDLHAFWVNSKVIELTGKLPDKVEGGEVLRDSNGVPTGIFLDQASTLLPKPEWSESTKRAFFLRAAEEALKVGVTKCHDAMTSEEEIGYYKKWAEEGILPMRMYLMANRVSGTGYWGKIPKLHNYGKDGRLNLRAIKLVGDGSLGSCSAVMYEPFQDVNTTGFFRVPLEEMQEFVPRFFEDGWQVNIHAIGDRANSEVLSIFEKELQGKGRDPKKFRPRIEHVQIMREQDFPRLGKSGVIASIQPTHATSDMAYAEKRLGFERAKGTYAFRKMINAGAPITLGSDFPVESNNPLVTFYAAITRLTAEGTSPHGPGGWFPDQRLTREETIKGLTLDPAYASFSEDELGSIKEGKKADFVIWSRDLMTVPR